MGKQWEVIHETEDTIHMVRDATPEEMAELMANPAMKNVWGSSNAATEIVKNYKVQSPRPDQENES